MNGRLPVLALLTAFTQMGLGAPGRPRSIMERFFTVGVIGTGMDAVAVLYDKAQQKTLHVRPGQHLAPFVKVRSVHDTEVAIVVSEKVFPLAPYHQPQSEKGVIEVIPHQWPTGVEVVDLDSLPQEDYEEGSNQAIVQSPFWQDRIRNLRDYMQTLPKDVLRDLSYKLRLRPLIPEDSRFQDDQ